MNIYREENDVQTQLFDNFLCHETRTKTTEEIHKRTLKKRSQIYREEEFGFNDTNILDIPDI